MLRTIDGLEKAEMMRTGYAIEYDAIVPTQLWPQSGDEAGGKSVYRGADQRNFRL